MHRYVSEAIPMVPIPIPSPVDTASQKPSKDLERPHLTSHIKETQMRIDRRILDNVAVNNLLISHHIQTPRILAYDATLENPLKSTFTVQSFANGIALCDVFERFTREEKYSMIDELVKFYVKANGIRFQYCGRLGFQTPLDSKTAIVPKARLGDSMFEHPPAGVMKFEVGIMETHPVDLESTLYRLLVSQLQAWLDYECRQSEKPNVSSEAYGYLLLAVEEMEKLEYFVSIPEYTILYHPDLEPRNILTDDGKISTILDWDDVLALPPVLTRKPIAWLWDFNDEYQEPDLPDGYDGDTDLFPIDRYAKGNGKLLDEDQRLKEYFEQQMVGKLGLTMQCYMDEVYGRGRWLRRLWRFAKEGFSDGEQYKRFLAFKREWEAEMGRVPDAA